MRCRRVEGREDDVVRLKDDINSYPLPAGLQHGDVVKLIAFDHGYWTVEKDGKRYSAFLIRLDTPMEYEFRGRWLPEGDTRVQAELARTSNLSPKAKACAEGATVYPFAG